MSMRIRVGESMSMGNDFDVFAHIGNDTSESRDCRLLLCARTVSYNGVLGPECGAENLSLTLDPYSGKALPARSIQDFTCAPHLPDPLSGITGAKPALSTSLVLWCLSMRVCMGMRACRRECVRG